MTITLNEKFTKIDLGVIEPGLPVSQDIVEALCKNQNFLEYQLNGITSSPTISVPGGARSPHNHSGYPRGTPIIRQVAFNMSPWSRTMRINSGDYEYKLNIELPDTVAGSTTAKPFYSPIYAREWDWDATDGYPKWLDGLDDAIHGDISHRGHRLAGAGLSTTTSRTTFGDGGSTWYVKCGPGTTHVAAWIMYDCLVKPQYPVSGQTGTGNMLAGGGPTLFLKRDGDSTPTVESPTATSTMGSRLPTHARAIVDLDSGIDPFSPMVMEFGPVSQLAMFGVAYPQKINSSGNAVMDGGMVPVTPGKTNGISLCFWTLPPRTRGMFFVHAYALFEVEMPRSNPEGT